MANPRDTGDNVKVDFVWGNVPMQPNDDRGGNTLDPDLDNHIIVVAEYNGFPGYTPVPPFTDTVENGTVPNVVGSTESAANSALVAVGLVKGAVTSTPVGATTVNDAKVKTQSVAAGTVVNEGTAVALTLFAAPTVPDVLGDDETTAGAALVAAGLVKGTVTTSTDGATELNDETVKSTTPAAGVKANTGSAVALTLFDYVAPAEPDLTFTAEVVGGDGLSFASSSEASVFDVEIGDVIVASGFDVLDETYTANPSGNFDVNGEWTVDRVSSVGAAPDIITIFSSSALRTATTGFDSMYAAVFGSGTIEVFKA
jgi:hypothetical protein